MSANLIVVFNQLVQICGHLNAGALKKQGNDILIYFLSLMYSSVFGVLPFTM